MGTTFESGTALFIPYYIRSSCESEVPVPMTLDFILERNTFCASNASLASWKDSSLAFFEQDASKRMASVMADNMDICFLPPKYDMRKLEVQGCLHFTLNRLFAADMIMFILSISDFV